MGVPHGLPQRLQKRLVGAEDHQLDDFARKAEIQQPFIVLVVRGQQRSRLHIENPGHSIIYPMVHRTAAINHPMEVG
jgi:hypothetical protein